MAWSHEGEFYAALAEPTSNLFEVRQKWDELDQLGTTQPPIRPLLDAAHADIVYVYDKWADQVERADALERTERRTRALLERAVQRLVEHGLPIADLEAAPDA